MMSQKEKNSCKSVNVEELVTVAFAEDMELAKQYKQLLEENEIDAQIRRQPEMAQNGFSDIAIVVSEDALDEAHTIISEKANYDDFFDMILEDQSGDRLDRLDIDIDEDGDLY
ncbi:MAG: hypothetical protein ACYSOF_10305 [Planctomycetota bacterium]|jgi:hypothetical protein